jgi:hypothetical protein
LANHGPEHNARVLQRVRDYATHEPSFTVTFAAWDLSRTGEKITAATVGRCVNELLKDKTIKLIEDGGRSGKVYAFNFVVNVHALPVRRFAELDDSRIGDLAPTRGVPVPHVRRRGTSGKPGKDKKLGEQGWKIKRERQGT